MISIKLRNFTADSFTIWYFPVKVKVKRKKQYINCKILTVRRSWKWKYSTLKYRKIYRDKGERHGNKFCLISLFIVDHRNLLFSFCHFYCPFYIFITLMSRTIFVYIFHNLGYKVSKVGSIMYNLHFVSCIINYCKTWESLVEELHEHNVHCSHGLHGFICNKQHTEHVLKWQLKVSQIRWFTF